MEKICSKCGDTKPLSEFYRTKQSRDGRYWHCKVCLGIYRKTWRQNNKEREAATVKKWQIANPEKVKAAYKKYEEKKRKTEGHRYGLTDEDIFTLIDNQNNLCAICGELLNLPKKRAVHIDHNHKTNEVRGILCRHCNLGLGNFKDNVIILNLAIKYLTKGIGVCQQ